MCFSLMHEQQEVQAFIQNIFALQSNKDRSYTNQVCGHQHIVQGLFLHLVSKALMGNLPLSTLKDADDSDDSSSGTSTTTSQPDENDENGEPQAMATCGPLVTFARYDDGKFELFQARTS